MQEGLGNALSKLNIHSVPTLHFFHYGKKASEVIGADVELGVVVCGGGRRFVGWGFCLSFGMLALAGFSSVRMDGLEAAGGVALLFLDGWLVLLIFAVSWVVDGRCWCGINNGLEVVARDEEVDCGMAVDAGQPCAAS
ncbi:unnamed protein product [Fraxinus pennsylvanica]|uniref:Uncharacterized protein n=1 Tax=Fraxinus pennsylvanica TaxID=56036 RepID=A0AAD1Z6W4_9LAMI|nr:unnamed protein product [Fraxinus pennsylvanica]